MKACSVVFISLTLLLPSVATSAQGVPSSERSEKRELTPAVLPGKGPAQHDFLYAGESKNRKIFIVREGRMVWSYDDPTGRGEIKFDDHALDGAEDPRGHLLFQRHEILKKSARGITIA